MEAAIVFAGEDRAVLWLFAAIKDIATSYNAETLLVSNVLALGSLACMLSAMPQILTPDHFDLARRLKEDEELKENLREKYLRIADLASSNLKPLAYKQEEARLMGQIWKDCGRNISSLIPYFYPKYPKNKPMSMADRPFNMMLLYLLPYHTFVLRGSRQIGKEQPYTAKVATPEGWRNMGALNVGDMIYGRDGCPCRVLEIHEQGEQEVYEMIFEDGATTRCGLEHNWLVSESPGSEFGVRTLREILEIQGERPQTLRVPLCGAVDYPSNRAAGPAYLMGHLLGTANKRRGSRILRVGTRISAFLLLGPAATRLELLRGLIDSSGTPTGSTSAIFTTIVESLAKDVVELARSLGGQAKLERPGTTTGLRKWRVTLTCLTAIPFRKNASRYAVGERTCGRERGIRAIRRRGREQCRCLVVSSTDHTYLTDDYIVTHNTVTLGTRQRTNAHLFSNFTSLYVAPHMEPLKTYTRKYMDIDRAFKFPGPVGDKYKQNQTFREYPNGAKVEMLRIQTSATPCRGKSFQELLLDEVQLFDPGLETEVLEVLNDSDIKSVVYAGTSTTVETLLEHRYQEGVQGVWHVLLDDGKTLNCGNAEEVMRYIGPYYMQDPKTGKKIDPLRGFYMYENPSGFENNVISVHIPQIINPDKANNPLEWNGIYKTMIRDPKKMIQEKLGIPIAEANQEVSENDLKRICVLEDGPEARKEKCRKGHYRLIVSGFDWGGSDYNPMTRTKISSTCHAIIGVSPDDRVHLLHVRRHAGRDYKSIMNTIVADHRAYSAGAMASDFGGGQQYHALLRTHPHIDASRHIIFDYSAPEAAICAPSKTSTLENMLMLNRTESITALYMAIVMADPILLSPSWLEMEEYLKDFLNMSRVLLEKESGTKGRRFVYHRHASRPDDVVHAINFAYSLLRLSVQQLLIDDPAARTMIRDAVYGGRPDSVRTLNPFAKALSNYARGADSHD
jgi:hypothetical protein